MHKLALTLIFVGALTMAVFYLLPREGSGVDAIAPSQKDMADEPEASVDLRGDDTSRQSQSPVVWEAMLDEDVPLDLLHRNSDIHYLKISGLDKLVEGDRITFFIPQENSHYVAVIDTVSSSLSGNRSLVGRIEGDGQDRYKLLLTVGPDQSFVTLNTPAGRYQMEIRNGIGRIISSAAIDSKLDYAKPDYLIPDRFESNRKSSGADSG